MNYLVRLSACRRRQLRSKMVLALCIGITAVLALTGCRTVYLDETTPPGDPLPPVTGSNTGSQASMPG